MEKYITGFNKNGYVVIKNYFSENESNHITEIADRMEKLPETPGKWMIYFENKTKKTRLEHFVNYNSEIKDILEKVSKDIEIITEKKLNLFKDKLNWKHPGGKGFRAHQDHPAWDDFEPDIFYSAAFFGNNSTQENGCLQFAKSSSKFTELCGYDQEGSGELHKDITDSIEWKNEETTPRDILLFDSYVPHRSGPNNSKNSRRIFYFTFNEEKYGNLYKKYFVKKRENFPPEIERKKGEKVKIYSNKYNLANPII